MELTTILTDLGLSVQEAKIYITCWELGNSEVSNIAKKSGFQRTAVYPIIKKLIRKGFVSVYFKGNKRQYRAQSPDKLARSFSKRLEAFETVIPFLKSLEKQRIGDFGLQFIETTLELKRFYESVVENYQGRTYYIIGDAKAWEGIEPEFFVRFRKARAQAQIRTKLILSAKSRGVVPRDDELLREEKFLSDKYYFQSTLDIYPDKILVVNPELSALAVVINVPQMVDVFKTVFDLLWDILPENS